MKKQCSLIAGNIKWLLSQQLRLLLKLGCKLLRSPSTLLYIYTLTSHNTIVQIFTYNLVRGKPSLDLKMVSFTKNLIGVMF